MSKVKWRYNKFFFFFFNEHSTIIYIHYKHVVLLLFNTYFYIFEEPSIIDIDLEFFPVSYALFFYIKLFIDILNLFVKYQFQLPVCFFLYYIYFFLTLWPQFWNNYTLFLMITCKVRFHHIALLINPIKIG